MAATATESVDWLPSVITGFFTLVAGLSGVYLTLRLTRKAAKEDRAEQRSHDHRLEQRRAIADLLDAGDRWTTTQEGLMLAMAAVADPVELTSMDTWSSHSEARETYRKALIRARLVVSDPALSESVVALSSGLESVSTYFEPILESTLKLGRATAESVSGGMAFVDRQKALLKELEGLALARLAA